MWIRQLTWWLTQQRARSRASTTPQVGPGLSRPLPRLMSVRSRSSSVCTLRNALQAQKTGTLRVACAGAEQLQEGIDQGAAQLQRAADRAPDVAADLVQQVSHCLQVLLYPASAQRQFCMAAIITAPHSAGFRAPASSPQHLQPAGLHLNPAQSPSSQAGRELQERMMLPLCHPESRRLTPL